MKCTHCGHENREGVKFCEECGQLLAVKAARFCSNCGHENRAGVKFCEQCGTDLATGIMPSAATGAQAAPPPVVVQVAAPPHRRLFNPLWLVLILLFLLISCCCLLMLLGLVDAPVVAAPIMDPVIEKVRLVLPWEELPEEINIGPVHIDLPNAAPPKAPEPQPDVKEEKPPVQWGGCERNTTKALCEQGGGTWFQTSTVDEASEKYCICQNDPQDPAQRDETWCTSQGGTWVDSFSECSFMNPCAGYTDQNSCTAANNDAWWYDPGKYCVCRSFGKYDEKDCNLPDNLSIGDMIYDSGSFEINIDIDSSQPDKFPEGSDWDVKVVKNNASVGVLGCEVIGQSTLMCPQDALPEFKSDWPGSDLYLCRDTYCCVRVANIEPDVVYGLTGAAPAGSCCEVVETEKVRQERDTEKGPLMLRFNLVCDEPWALAGDSINWDAFITKSLDLKWTSGTCSYDGDDTRQLECEADIQAEGQKKSLTKIVLDDCPDLDITFQSPYYTPPVVHDKKSSSGSCPSGQSMCQGSCCPSGCVCDSLYGCSC